jgi:hypothetical protein
MEFLAAAGISIKQRATVFLGYETDNTIDGLEGLFEGVEDAYKSTPLRAR